ncbi:MAG: T9SS type A sorting domain-containing protein, partial [Ignavibacteriaceae bacterium]|nr:T9SS type A sorting domain-containing protein [Ignavibacteriaceae bacterium]
DTGKTWVKEFDNQNGFIGDIVFTDENTGWFFSGGGGTLSNIYRTTNGGHGGIVSVDENQSKLMVSNYILEQNFPNPLNPTTTIKYQIPELSFVTLKVYDVLGNEVETIVNEEKQTGSYDVEFDGTELTSGVYFFRLQAGSFVETKKMVLMK